MLRNCSLFFSTAASRRLITRTAHTITMREIIEEARILETRLFEAREIIKQMNDLTKNLGIIDPQTREQIEQHLREHASSKDQEHISRIEHCQTKLDELTAQRQILLEQRDIASGTAKILDKALPHLDSSIRSLQSEIESLKLLGSADQGEESESFVSRKLREEIAKLNEEDFDFDIPRGGSKNSL